MAHVLSAAEHARHAAFVVKLLGATNPEGAQVGAWAARHLECERSVSSSPWDPEPDEDDSERLSREVSPEVRPAWDPPYESPIEEGFARQAAYLWADKTRVYKQFPVSTRYGLFRLDFALEVHSWRVGIECDGKEFHDRERDTYRDAAILGSRAVDEILRFRGVDLYRCPDDCLCILSRVNDHLFRHEGLRRLDRNASYGARSVEFNRESEVIEFTGSYFDFEGNEREHEQEVLWRCWSARGMPTVWQQRYRTMLALVPWAATIDDVVRVMRARGFRH